MDASTHVSILSLHSTYLCKLVDLLRIQLVMVEQALAERVQPTFAHIAPYTEELSQRSQQLVLEINRLHARIEELAAKSRTGSDNSEQTPIPILAQP